MGESLLEDNGGVEWHTHDIYEGAGGNVHHAHSEGRGAHAHDWDEAKPVGENRDTFSLEADRLK